MPRTFELHIKQGGEWQKVTAVFPFTSADLLDERLDEGSITFFDRIKAHKPLTEVRITFYKNDQPDNDRYGKNTEYFIIANDNSAEYPVGSGVYKHETYIIERTKLLEGILCPSITFTNSNERKFNPRTNTVAPEMEDGSVPFTGIPEITSPIDPTKTVTVPSPETVGVAFVRAYNEFAPLSSVVYFSNYGDSQSEVKVYSNGNEIASGTDSSGGVSLSPETLENVTNLEYVYTIWLSITEPDGMGGYYTRYDDDTITFKLQTTPNQKALKPYTITDCVNRVLELANPLTTGENPRFVFNGVTYNNGISEPNYEEGSQAEKYDKIIAPEFSMTQSTLREQLKVIGAYIHAEPWLDENNVIHFLEYGNVKQSQDVNKNTPYISNTLKTDINQYCTDIRSNAQNLVNSLGFAKGVITDPGGALYRSLRAETMYVRINEKNGLADTDFPIYSIESVLCGVVNGNENAFTWEYDPKDITAYIFEETEYSANLSSFGGFYPRSKAWAIYYTQGQKGLRGLFYQNPDNANTATYSPWAIANILCAVNEGTNPQGVYDSILQKSSNIVFQITYKPIAPAFISHGKQYYISGETPYTQIYNQGDNLIETQYYGEHLKGVSARLGNIEQERTYLFKNRSQIPRIGDMIDDYAISAVHCEYLPSYIKCMVGLSKNYQRISEYVGINSVKRMYEISERQAQRRDILIKDSLVISDTDDVSDAKCIFDNHNLFAFFNAIKGGIRSNRIIGAVVSTYSKRQDLLYQVLLPCIGRAFGNSIHFAFAMKDNFSAGNATVWGSAVEVENGTEKRVSGRWQSDVPYSNDYGRAYWSKIQLTNDVGDYSSDVSKFIGASFTLPALDNLTPEYVNEHWHRLRKDNREIISYNLEIEYKTDPNSDIIIGSELAARCNYVSSAGASFIYLTKHKINKFDTNFVINMSEGVLYDAEGNVVIEQSNRDFFYIIANNVDTDSPNDKLKIYIEGSIYENAVNNGYKYWAFLARPTEKEVKEKYINEDGEIVELNIGSEYKILLSGKLDTNFVDDEWSSEGQSANENDISGYSRTLHFYFKRS